MKKIELFIQLNLEIKKRDHIFALPLTKRAHQ